MSDLQEEEAALPRCADLEQQLQPLVEDADAQRNLLAHTLSPTRLFVLSACSTAFPGRGDPGTGIYLFAGQDCSVALDPLIERLMTRLTTQSPAPQ